MGFEGDTVVVDVGERSLPFAVSSSSGASVASIEMTFLNPAPSDMTWKAAAVGVGGSGPVHEFPEPARRVDDLGPGCRYRW